MRSESWAKLLFGCLAICTGGSLAGIGLANYTSSGASHFYKQTALESRWRAPRPAEASSLQTSELGYASAYRTIDAVEEPTPRYASFD